MQAASRLRRLSQLVMAFTLFIGFTAADAIGDDRQNSEMRKSAPAETIKSKAPKITKKASVRNKGDTLTAAPGSVLENGPNGSVIARRNDGGVGGLGATMDCYCKSGDGECTAYKSEENAKCVAGEGDNQCTQCRWKEVASPSGPAVIQ
jgi:hypothetical protein